ncbi:hypothetical protein I3700191H1_13690 [Megasphaera massiliensis]|uniref:hypothetical protein n=1 Tax=Megasphaera massiliensis TaxID=1232428 RepID=UPI0034AA6207
MTQREENLKYALEQINICTDKLAKGLALDNFDALSYRIAYRRVDLNDAIRRFCQIDKGLDYSEEEVERLGEQYAFQAQITAQTWLWILEHKADK